MPAKCSECGAALIEDGACIDLFNAMLLLESEVIADPAKTIGGRGEVAHFHAISSYILQHPDGMNFTVAALDGVRRNIADHLAGRATLAELRTRVRLTADGPARITRRAGDEVPCWRVDAWPMTVADILAGGVEGYCEHVAIWAEAIIRTLNATEA